MVDNWMVSAPQRPRKSRNDYTDAEELQDDEDRWDERAGLQRAREREI